MNQFKGTGVALVTPFHDDCSIDFTGLKKLIDHVIDGGVDYLVVLGTTGESATLLPAEKKQVLAACLEYNAGRVPVVYGVGGNNTQFALPQEAAAAKIDSACRTRAGRMCCGVGSCVGWFGLMSDGLRRTGKGMAVFERGRES